MHYYIHMSFSITQLSVLLCQHILSNCILLYHSLFDDIILCNILYYSIVLQTYSIQFSSSYPHDITYIEHTSVTRSLWTI